eukprot:148214-Alexandrium_andersonii.AAC.1
MSVPHLLPGIGGQPQSVAALGSHPRSKMVLRVVAAGPLAQAAPILLPTTLEQAQRQASSIL